MAQLNASPIRYDICPSGAGSTENPYAMALGFVPAGMGRDLLEYLYWPDGAALRGAAIYRSIVKVLMAEWSRRQSLLASARAAYGMAASIANFNRRQDEATKREIEILKSRVAVARQNAWPDNVEDRLPLLIPLLLRAMKGEKLSGVERAKAMNMSESAYREGWNSAYEWGLTAMIDAEAEAARAMERALRDRAA
ncbi:hypothetical protein JAK47_01745 [Stenotrophomonas maltophilia]|uniref:hypothetical protein n=1 Tax=Stenotrophomonas maltophilia TaxID=40324 RepID=UPI0021C6B63B|nr:hypothetical protein [Stenotrophomonas maltophilia]MCU1053268.1 hypothetical protein [Stenotrophomonas maltophilia]